MGSGSTHAQNTTCNARQTPLPATREVAPTRTNPDVLLTRGLSQHTHTYAPPEDAPMGSRSTHAQNPTSNAEHTHAAAPMPALHEGFRACVPQRSLSKPALHEGLRPSKHCTKDFVRDPSCVCDSVARTVSCVCASALPMPALHEGIRACVCSAGPLAAWHEGFPVCVCSALAM